MSLREILSNYNANQLNHLVGTKWGIRFKGKGDYIQFFIEKLSMDSYIRGVLRRLSADEIELLRFMVIKGEAVREDVLKKMHDSRWSFEGAMTALMSYFLVYSCDNKYFVPEELIDPLKKALNIEEKNFRIIPEISRYLVRGNLAYDILSILWFGATNGIELTQRDEPLKYSAEKIMQMMNSSDEFKEAKFRTCIRFLLNSGALCRSGNRLVIDLDSTEKLLAGSDIEVMNRVVSECDAIAVLSNGSYTFKQIKGADEFLQVLLLKLEKNRWYEVEPTVESIRRDSIKEGRTARWISSSEMEAYILFLSWLGILAFGESVDGRKAFRVEERKSKIEKKFIVINPNFEITLFLDKADIFEAFNVMCCGNVERIDIITMVQLDREILASAHIDNPIAYLKKISMKPVPNNVEIYMKEWLTSKKIAVVKKATVIFFDKKSYLDEITIKYPDLIERLSPKVAIIDEKLIEKLKKEGYLIKEA